MRNFISVQDAGDPDYLVRLAASYKADPLKDVHAGRGRRIGMLFLNPSMRTRISTQIAARNLGMEPVVLNLAGEGWKIELEEGVVMDGATVEHIRDAAPVLGGYFDVICIRSFPALESRELDYRELFVSQLIRYAGVPVVSLESSLLHPLQSLADLLTIHEHMPGGRKPKVVLSWAPHVKPIAHCVANSFAEWVRVWGKADLVIANPEGYDLDRRFTGDAPVLHDQSEALAGADFVYVKNWSSWEDYGKLPPVQGDWMLTESSLAEAPASRVMHCLPVRRNVELSEELLDGPRSLVQVQAANRVWAAQAVLAEIIKQ